MVKPQGHLAGHIGPREMLTQFLARIHQVLAGDRSAPLLLRQVVGLAAGVDEEADGERRGHGGRELGRELRDVGVEVARVGVERPDLRRHRRVRVHDAFRPARGACPSQLKVPD